MIFIDSNIPMYIVGGPHPHKTGAQFLVERLILRRERLVTDAEVLQEILHRYSAIRRLEAVPAAFDTLLRYVDAVLPVTIEDVVAAKDLILAAPMLSARDALHASVMLRHGIHEIASFDSGFDGVEGITRITR